jgi:hypothetical protein
MVDSFFRRKLNVAWVLVLDCGIIIMVGVDFFIPTHIFPMLNRVKRLEYIYIDIFFKYVYVITHKKL